MRESWDRDRDPLAGLVRGDAQLFEQFVRAEAGTFAGFFGRLGADLQEAEDLTQELFLKLYKHASSYVASERFTAYAFRIARNAWIDRSRRRATRGCFEAVPARNEGDEELPGPLENAVSTLPDAARLSAAREESERLHTALAGLSKPHREVFELGALQELSYPEVSELLEVPVGTVKSRMFYAIRQLREVLEPDSDRDSDAAGAREEPA